MNRDHQIDKRTTGLYGKFSVRRNDGTDAPGQKAGDATPPATPQPETPDKCPTCGAYGVRMSALSPPPDVERPDDDRQKAADEAHPSFIVTCRACGSTVVSVQSDVGYSPLSGGWGGVHLHCESCHADDAIWSMS
jgi:hypothetical protein